MPTHFACASILQMLEGAPAGADALIEGIPALDEAEEGCLRMIRKM